MERTITYEGRSWQVRVNPAPVERDAESGLELVFSDREGQRSVTVPIGKGLLRALSREALELDEAVLREELRRGLEDVPGSGAEPGEGGADGE